LQNILAHREARAGLLLVTDQRQVRIEQIMRGASLSPTAKAEVDYLLARLAKVDKRAELAPRLAQAT